MLMHLYSRLTVYRRYFFDSTGAGKDGRSKPALQEALRASANLFALLEYVRELARAI